MICWLQTLILHQTTAVWQATIRLYLWRWRPRFAIHLYPPQPHVRKGHRRLPRCLCPWVLPPTYGRGRCTQCHCYFGVRCVVHSGTLVNSRDGWTAVPLDTCFRPCPSCGAPMRLQAYLWWFCGCQNSDCCSLTPLDCCTVVSRFSVYLMSEVVRSNVSFHVFS